MKTILGLLFVGLFNVAQAQDLRWLDGEWQGLGFQSNGTSWTMRVNANMENYSVTIEYPSLECGGVWQVQSSDACAVELVEDIQYGEDKCIDGGIVVVTRVDDDHISFSYFLAGSRSLEAYATLVRTR